MKLNVDGQVYDITNWDEFKDDLLTAVGLQIEDEIVMQINKLRLVDTGRFKGSIKSTVVGGDLIITSDAPYAKYLEYGTFEYWQTFGKNSFPKSPDPKKKNMTRKQASAYLKGGQPFAPFRRVLYNQNIMSRIINKAARLASK
jgi:hypothetical protein